MAFRALSRIPRLIRASAPQRPLHSLSNGFESKHLTNPSSTGLPCQTIQLLRHSALNYATFNFSSSASTTKPTNKKTSQLPDQDNESQHAKEDDTDTDSVKTSGDSTSPEQTGESELDLSIDDLVKLVVEKEELLKLKHKEIEKMQDKVLRSYAEMENVLDRTRREAENSKKFAVQSFAKSLLDVADNLGRASSVVKESFEKIDPSKDSCGAVPLLKTLLEGVEMTDKQLAEVFKKFGVEKYDPINENFDPNRHNAVFQIPDASKPPETVAVVLKPGYKLYDRIIRPAEVGVTQASSNE